jgi:histidine ammonia-lyase
MCGAQGIDYREPLRPGVGVARAHERVRAVVSTLERDRVLSGDIQTIASEIADGRFDACFTGEIRR